MFCSIQSNIQFRQYNSLELKLEFYNLNQAKNM